MKIVRATAEATPNIAIIKYWGKRDEKLILPQESSISVTLNQLKTRTTAAFSEKFKEDEIWINNKKLTTPDELEKALPQLNVIREIAKIDMKAKIISYSIAPVAGGLAGSAAGLCALAAAATKALNMKIDSRQLSILCRRGSGSACRSVYGGFVEWLKGERQDGSDSYAVQIADENYWPEFRIVIGIAQSKEKKVKSRAGMKQTVATSILYPSRLNYLPKILEETKKAILGKNLENLCEIAMHESNNMHSVMLDTWPPIMYLNDVSKEVIYAIHEFNQNGIKAGYSFDAGPNPTIFTTEKYEKQIEKILKDCGIENTLISYVGSGPKIIEHEKEQLIDENGEIKKHYLKNDKIIVER